MREPPQDKPVRRRRPTLSAALKAAKQAGQRVKGAVVEPDGKITLTFGESALDGTSDDWDRKLEELEGGKH